MPTNRARMLIMPVEWIPERIYINGLEVKWLFLPERDFPFSPCMEVVRSPVLRGYPFSLILDLHFGHVTSL